MRSTRARIAAWRIVKARYAATAFDGEGARLEGGRWNSPGVAVVYTAGSLSLATLEMLVHLGRATSLPSYVVVPCTFDPALVTRLDRRQLPDDWHAYPARPSLQQLGDAWVRAAETPVLEVPSAVVRSESNYLLNRRHPAFADITVLDAEPFVLDLRLISGAGAST